MNDEEVKLKCLKLAILGADENVGAYDIVVKAEIYYEFIQMSSYKNE